MGQDESTEGFFDPHATLAVNQPIKLTTLRVMSYTEAELAKIKLESEGIPAYIANKEIAVANPLIFSDVKLQVRLQDLQRANEILETPAPDPMDGDYAEENFRCPNCHKRKVELLPLTGIWKLIKFTTLGMCGLFVLLIAINLFAPREVTEAISEYNGLICPWSRSLASSSSPSPSRRTSTAAQNATTPGPLNNFGIGTSAPASSRIFHRFRED